MYLCNDHIFIITDKASFGIDLIHLIVLQADFHFNLKIEVICLTLISISFGAFTAFMLVDRIILISAVCQYFIPLNCSTGSKRSLQESSSQVNFVVFLQLPSVLKW